MEPESQRPALSASSGQQADETHPLRKSLCKLGKRCCNELPNTNRETNRKKQGNVTPPKGYNHWVVIGHHEMGNGNLHTVWKNS